jgi:predicted Zn-dependent protease|tara:strand:- start:3053 stop:3475 length:423 start_codon:yes stop_codon:yes gene_type:complete
LIGLKLYNLKPLLFPRRGLLFQIETKNLNLKLPKELFEAAKLDSESRYKKAEPILRDYLKKDPLDVNDMKLLADIGIEFRACKEAGYLLSRALDLFLDFHFARFSYANFAKEWMTMGCKVIGGCCSTTPEHIRMLAELKA